MADAVGPVITRREWRWAAGLAVSVLALTSLPYLAAIAAQTPGWRFSGLLIGVEDGYSYLAKMAEGARGQWLFTPVYTSEPHPGVLLYSFYLLLGKLAGVDPTAQIIVFHAARLGAGLLALLASYRFLAEFLPFEHQRRLGLLLVAVGGGLGWLLVLLGQGGWLGSLPLEFFSPEAYTFITLYSLPHLAFSRAFLLLGGVAYLRGRPGWAGLAWCLVAFIQPIHVLAMWAVVGLDWLGRGRAALGWRAFSRAALAVTLSAPVVIYTVALFGLDPLFRQWNSQSVLPPPSWLHYLAGYGLWLGPGLFGWRVLRRRPALARWAAAWLLAVVFCLSVPSPIQRRLVEGVQLPLVVLAVLGLTEIWRRRWLTWLVVGASSLTALFLIAGGLVVARQPQPPVFQSAEQRAVFAWVAAQPHAAGVGLAAYSTGNLLPAYTPLVAYIGLTTETVAFTEKEARVAEFFSAATSAAARRQLLSESQIRYVFVGPLERALGGFDPEAAGDLRLAFRAGDYAVYQVIVP